MNEEWKTILEAPDYEISNTGEFRNKKTKNRVKTRISKRFGYVQVNLQVGPKGERKQKTFRVHRLVAKAFIPNPNNLPQIYHINGIKTDNQVGNLEWVTGAENTKRAFEKGLAKIRSNEHMQAMVVKTKKACIIVDILESKKYFLKHEGKLVHSLVKATHGQQY